MSIQLNKRSAIVNEIIRKRLESGEMPSSSEIMQMICDEAALVKSSAPTSTPPSILNGELIPAELINETAAGIELDMLAMRTTLDEAWIALKDIVDKAMRTMPVIEREADVIANTAIRALSLTPEADAVRVGTQALSVAAGIGFGSVNGADMKLSSGIEIDTVAGALILERSSVLVIPAVADDTAWSLTGEYDMRVDSKIGSPSWTIDGNIAKTWTVVGSSPSKYGRVTLSARYTLSAAATPLKRIEILVPDAIQTDVDVYVDFDGLGNFVFWEKGSGKGRIIVDGEMVNARSVRVELSRYQANGSYYVGSRPRHEYAFQVAEVTFVSGAYATEGNVVTDPIDLGLEQIASTVVDIEATIPATAAVNTYIARDVEDATSLNDFMWVPVDANTGVADLMQIVFETQTVTALAPIKVRTGAGLYSNSIYDVADIDGTVLRVDEGFGQLELRHMGSVVAASAAELPSMTSLNWSNPVGRGVIDHSDTVFSGSNYYRLSTSIWASVSSSHPVRLTLPATVTDYAVFLNDVDITERMKDGAFSASFVPGRNNLVIYLMTGMTAKEVSFSIADIPGCTMAIDRPKVVQESALNTSEGRVAQVDGALLVNHDPSGRVMRVMVKKATGESVSSIRLRVQLKRGIKGETPQIKSAYITSGV